VSSTYQGEDIRGVDRSLPRFIEAVVGKGEEIRELPGFWKPMAPPFLVQVAAKCIGEHHFPP
jgi:hypothetical protein